MNFIPALNGFILMLSVIVAIGPQNAFLLRQAVRHEHAWLVAAIMLTGDIIMVALGGFGIGHILEQWLWVKFLLTLLGALYILNFGIRVLRQINKQAALHVECAAGSTGIRSATKKVTMGALAVTFLNPHAIFDTVVLVGTLSLQYGEFDKKLFMFGAICGSCLWFFGIAWLGQKLAPILSKPNIWKMIDMFVAFVMFVLALKLAGDAWTQLQVILLSQT